MGSTFASLLALALLAGLGAGGCALGSSGDGSPERRTPPPIGVERPAASATIPTVVVTPPETTRDCGLPSAVPGEWTWMDVPEARCANGSPTGIAVNVRPGATHLVFFLEGGGACDNGHDCWVQPTAANIANGYGVTQLERDTHLGLPIFDRGEVANPFAGASYVLVPYCTGDLHAGNAVADYVVDGHRAPTYHYGARNLDLYLRLLDGAFPGLDHVWLVGESAGGFGTLFNESFVQRAFGVPTDVIDDSGPGIGASGYPTSWNVRLPPACAGCADGLQAMFDFDRAAYPDSRFAFLSFRHDSALPGFYGASPSQVAGWLGQYERALTQLPGARSFVAPGTGHVVMDSPLDDDMRLAMLGWLAQMADGSPTWGDFLPPALMTSP